MVAMRVVQGGGSFKAAAKYDEKVAKEIERREELAPQHNANSLKIIQAIAQHSSRLPVYVGFDTSFHRTLPELAWRYPVNRVLADRYEIRKFGFHGLSHRYMLERYAELSGMTADRVSLITLHLENGSSAAAIRKGKSVDTSMGFTPLEGLMMGTRCGSIDPAIVSFLIRHSGLGLKKIVEILEKKSGLLWISGYSNDTRTLRKRSDAHAKLAMAMFGYRVRCQIGAYMAALGRVNAILFGGGIGENTPEIRKWACQGLDHFGVLLSDQVQSRTREGDVQISVKSSRVEVWVIHSEESLQLAHECVLAQQTPARQVNRREPLTQG